jgi:hypothetical protein
MRFLLCHVRNVLSCSVRKHSSHLREIIHYIDDKSSTTFSEKSSTTFSEKSSTTLREIIFYVSEELSVMF